MAGVKGTEIFFIELWCCFNFRVDMVKTTSDATFVVAWAAIKKNPARRLSRTQVKKMRCAGLHVAAMI